MTHEDKLRSAIKKLIEQQLFETTTTANSPGYETPKAFTDKSNKAKEHRKKNAKVLGYISVDDGVDESIQPIIEEKPRTPKQQIGYAIKEINNHINEINSILDKNIKLKTESNLQKEDMWKRTQTHLVRLETKLNKMTNKLREMRS